MTEKPEVEEKHKEIAKEMRKEYDEDRPTVTMPGSGGTVSGTAVADWLDDDGNPKYGDQSRVRRVGTKGEAERRRLAPSQRSSRTRLSIGGAGAY